jgi:hypothetical protein
LNQKLHDYGLTFQILSAGWDCSMRTAAPEPPKETREPVTIRLPPSVMKKFRMAVTEEHGSYAGGWLSFEAERALRGHLVLQELAEESGPEGDVARKILERATA